MPGFRPFFFFFFSDFRSTISGVPYSSYGYCGNPGFFEATSVGWSSTINMSYRDNQQCYWFIYNPQPTGHMQLSFSNFNVSYSVMWSYSHPIYFKKSLFAIFSIFRLHYNVLSLIHMFESWTSPTKTDTDLKSLGSANSWTSKSGFVKLL